MVAAATTGRRWTYADLEDLPDDDQMYDIVGGELIVRNAPGPEHAEVLTELITFLIAAQEAGYGRMYTTSSAVALDYAQHGDEAQDVPHPDLFFLRQDRLGIRGKRGWEGVPDLIVEILSPSTRRRHFPGGTHWQMFERNGVPHYWLADWRSRTIRQYTLVGEAYVEGHYNDPVILREGDTLTSPLFPGLTLPVQRVFRYVRR
ncbi:MAG: Uma2 family endonuclease [Chloroflexota bacterium]